MEKDHQYYKLLKTDIIGIPTAEPIAESTLECELLCTQALDLCTALRIVKLDDGSDNYKCQMLKKWTISTEYSSAQTAMKLRKIIIFYK